MSQSSDSTNFYNRSLLMRYQLTFLTSRTMSFILFFFWFCSFFFGNTLISILLNFSSLCDTIPSSFFTLTKEHTIFQTFSSRGETSNRISFLLFIFTTHSLYYLVNLKSPSIYTPLSTLTTNRQLLALITTILFVFLVVSPAIQPVSTFLIFLQN